MNLYLDTSNEDFALAIFDSNYQLIDKIVLENYPKKVELIDKYIRSFLDKYNYKIDEFSNFFLNIGPGYFTGVRISLVYLRTIALLKNINLRTTSIFEILLLQNPFENDFYVNASGNKNYFYHRKNYFDIKDVEVRINDKKTNFKKIDFDKFFNNFSFYLSVFKYHTNLLEIDPYYIKMPQIGQRKDK
ncbi:hypothetical protein MM26B8_03860 [Mycoplasmopsis meleagridis]|uniref:Gcp-like domain-containing protein n=1 Tax=Mycoplasmopsis meleagridis ATCC 25294 TaxID=1264554 RepID=A0A0F5H0R8_9BACT|nr:hypothetical protein [Mycoplasmopsis meleagridis]KKB26798.1 hypothetical protein MMELEA_01890 [Mycoplasmopsis meleagridis ATCC 25294]KUH47258.1 hypothetical protein ASB56_02460 [Mycoplasmopsis meleagridis]OAD18085.1 hypothetical protein MM26B8_03860 [Mycoplasmopsis meleagridis]VEU77333.1 molecular chaperone [Mycoplasmopsis meleagridis]